LNKKRRTVFKTKSFFIPRHREGATWIRQPRKEKSWWPTEEKSEHISEITYGPIFPALRGVFVDGGSAKHAELEVLERAGQGDGFRQDRFKRTLETILV